MEIVAREKELAAVRAFIDVEHAGAAALVLEGDAGIGKSTLWRAGVEHARSCGVRVLISRPAEVELGLGHAGLSDLFEDVLGEVLPALSAPRRRAVEAALLLEEPDGETVDPRALAIGIRSSLQLLAEDVPVLVAIDDVQWFDDSSTRALAFALRRLAASRVLFLLARRLVDDAKPSGLEHGLGEVGVERLRIGSLSVGAVHQVLRDRLGRSFAHQTLLRLYERSGGNPFFALELARLLVTDVDPLEPLAVPATLEEMLRGRISGLPKATRAALAVAAALGSSSYPLLEQLGIEPADLEPAFAADVIERDRGTIRFTHPLLSSVLYGDLGAERQRIHGRVAEIVGDPFLAARHLALSTVGPDAKIARLLDQKATEATQSGASEVAAELAEQALRLTPSDDRDEPRRALRAARAQHVAGEWTRARTIASDLLSETRAGELRAETLVLLAELESLDRAEELLDEALRETDSHAGLQSIIHCRLAWATRFKGGFEHAQAALRLAEQLDDDVLRTRAEAVQSILGWFAGEAETTEDLPSRSHEFASAVGGEHLVQEATLAIVNTLAPRDRRDEARFFFEGEHNRWRERDEPRSARALWGLSWVEFLTGSWQLAATYADRAHDISIQYGIEVPQDHLPIALIALHRGELDVAREHSTRALELAEEQFAIHPPQHLAILGLAALWSDDAATAARWLAKADAQAASLGWREPSVRWWTPDFAEMLLTSGRTADAVSLVDTWEADAVRVRRPWVLAHVTHCRGLIAAAAGNPVVAAELLERAGGEHEAVGDLFGQARASLALGIVLRRTQQKRAARVALAAAREGFERLGAATWAAQARMEIGSIGGRIRQAGLTSAERRVARLVVEGRTNREVAAALFLNERTVAGHLTHIYAKLGVRSRTELARQLR